MKTSKKEKKRIGNEKKMNVFYIEKICLKLWQKCINRII